MSTVLKFSIILFFVLFFKCYGSISLDCRDRSNTLRQDGSQCFELTSWQHKPVELDEHISTLRDRWPEDPNSIRKSNARMLTSSMVSNEVYRYTDIVLFPFLDTYHKNIQHSYQQFTQKILKKIKEEINLAVHKKQQIYDELTKLAETLNVPDLCDEERRLARTVASKHVALVYACTEEARKSITKMGKYADQMISITKNHMQAAVENTTKTLETIARTGTQPVDCTSSIQDLSKAAVKLGYELDLSLTNARRHNEQSCERLTTCCVKAKKASEEEVTELKNSLAQCVYA